MAFYESVLLLLLVVLLLLLLLLLLLAVLSVLLGLSLLSLLLSSSVLLVLSLLRCFVAVGAVCCRCCRCCRCRRRGCLCCRRLPLSWLLSWLLSCCCRCCCLAAVGVLCRCCCFVPGLFRAVVVVLWVRVACLCRVLGSLSLLVSFACCRVFVLRVGGVGSSGWWCALFLVLLLRLFLSCFTSRGALRQNST